jgi:hypothetical protein
VLHRTLVAVLVLSSALATHAEEPRPLPGINIVTPLPPVDQGFFEKIRLAALGDPQDLTEPLLPDDVAPPGQPRQEFEPPAGRKLPPGAKPGMLQQALFQVTELPKLGSGGLGLTTLETSMTLGMPAPTPPLSRHDAPRSTRPSSKPATPPPRPLPSTTATWPNTCVDPIRKSRKILR